MTGIYIHIPFCDGKCPYCDFYSQKGDEETKDLYLAAMLKAIEEYPAPIFADTLYFGGGTPPLMGEKRLLRLVDAAVKRFNITKNAEVTLEANPHSISLEGLKNLKLGGFTRASFGVQSTDDETLKMLGRQHSGKDAYNAINEADCAGFKHISADLMLAVPNQTEEKIAKDIQKLSSLPLDHISAYLLKLEPNTPFFKLYKDMDDDISADYYLKAVEELDKHGFKQYEISNFAKNDAAQSQHNLKYWLLEDYLGIGPAAHSLINNKRFYFERDLKGFIKSKNIWQDAHFESVGNTEEEKIMLNLRLKTGLNCDELGERGKRILLHAENPQFSKFLDIKNNVISLNANGFLLSNRIINEFISL